MLEYVPVIRKTVNIWKMNDRMISENYKSDQGKIIVGTLLSIFAEGSTAKTVAAGTVQTR